ncbi:MAG: DNA repair protein RadC [Bacteroidales bacterium]
MEENKHFNSIREWAEDDRPREKLMLKGKHALSDAELLAILLGTGTRGESALDLAKKILRQAGDNLLELSRFTADELINRFKGMGPAKAITLLAALELGNRKRTSEALRKEKICNSRDAYEYLRGILGDNAYEEFWILVMNRANQIKRGICVSEGGFSGTVADPKKIFQLALEQKGSAIILAHNHPSGDPRPSDADLQLTKKMKEAGLMLEMPVIDHIIIGDEKYFSFADEGLL